MAHTRKQVITGISVVWLLITVGLAGYAASRSSAYSLPISSTLTTLTTALPILSGLLLELGYDLTRYNERHHKLPKGSIQRPPLVILANTIIIVFSTSIITLLGTHIAPSKQLDCRLRERWQNLFHLKDETSIRRIQDAFACCGLKNTRDMAWPFPDKTHGPNACEAAYGRHSACHEPWRQEETRVATILVGAVLMVVLWQLTIIFFPTHANSWLHQVTPNSVSRLLSDEHNGVVGNSRRTIAYGNGYSDRIQEAMNDDPISSRAIEEGNQRADGQLPGSIHRNTQAAVENE